MRLSEMVRLFGQMLRHPDSATARAVNDGRRPWTEADHLLSHVYTALTETKHPWTPQTPDERAEAARMDAQRDRALARKRARERQIAAGDIT